MLHSYFGRCIRSLAHSFRCPAPKQSLVLPRFRSFSTAALRHSKMTARAQDDDEIVIDALPVHARIGVSKEEREAPQPLVLHVSIFMDLKECGESDKLSETLSYAVLQKNLALHCHNTMYTEGVKTIECLAHQLARICIVQHGAPRVRVRIDKPGAIRCAKGASVIVERTRSDFIRSLWNELYASKSFKFPKISWDHSTSTVMLLGLGSNLGNRQQNIANAIKEIEKRIKLVAPIMTSFLYETSPAMVTDQPLFLNAACKVCTEMEPNEIFHVCKDIERYLGRDTSASAQRYGPRTIDIDLLLSNKVVKSDDPALFIPHLDLIHRAFALAPLCDVDPTFPHPFTGKSVHQHLRSVIDGQTTAAACTEHHEESISGVRRVYPVVDQLNPSVLLGSKKPIIMGVINVTPDSFADIDRIWDATDPIANAVVVAEKMVRDGASILDVGGCSTRPGATIISAKEEIDRVVPVVTAIRKHLPNVVISVDTVRGSVARAAIAAGASMINDVSSGTAWGIVDEESNLAVAAELNVPIVLMHNRGDPNNMSDKIQYTNVTNDVKAFLLGQLQRAIEMGIPRWNLILDPGFGFGKNQQLNLELLRNLEQITTAEELLGVPILVGISRKMFLGRIAAAAAKKHNTAAATTTTIENDVKNDGDNNNNTNNNNKPEIAPPYERVIGSAVSAAIAVSKGAKIVRVHDVEETRNALALVTAIWPSQDTY